MRTAYSERQPTVPTLDGVVSRCRADTNSKAEPHKYKFDYNTEPFSFEVTRMGPAAAPNEPALWNTTGLRMLYKDQYLELTSWVPPTSTVYGLGERISSSGVRPFHAPSAFLSRVFEGWLWPLALLQTYCLCASKLCTEVCSFLIYLMLARRVCMQGGHDVRCAQSTLSR